MRVIGTAGHVDHGKSTLVQALTGIDPDRLKEEKDRQMTIDLGFAWMTLPSGEGLGFVDVPGHRDFIENMLAGVGGIDAALLVIAADEGIMPQTREHVAILDLLEVSNLVVALSRIDLVQEKEWLDLVEEDVQTLLRPTHFAGAPVVRVSPVTGEGMAELVEQLDSLLKSAAPRKVIGKPRLPIDRAFTMAGFGTVVTGTLLDGELLKGSDVVLLPQGLRARIRGLQTHKEQVAVAEPGSRVAANIVGVGVDQIARGDVLSLPNADSPSTRIDVHCRMLQDAPVSIRHNTNLKFFSGSAQRMARVRLLQKEPLQAGETGWLQLELQYPIVIRRGDKFILRQASPGATLAGGRIADPHPHSRHKRTDARVLEGLEQLMSGEPAQVLKASIAGKAPVRVADAVDEAGIAEAEASQLLAELMEHGEVILLNETDDPAQWIVVSATGWQDYAQLAIEVLENYHTENPLRSGMPEGEIRSRLGYEDPVLLNALVMYGIVQRTASRIKLPEFEVEYSPDQARKLEELFQKFDNKPYSPPTYKECVDAVGADIIEGQIEGGRLTKVSDSVLFDRVTYDEMRGKVIEVLRTEGEITIAEVRDLFDTTRKYALALMEHFDSIGLTYRRGDARRLVREGSN